MMPVVRYYPEWWIVMTLDGFAYNLDMADLLIFLKHKIIILKEKGDTSQGCQAYNQQVAKQDKL